MSSLTPAQEPVAWGALIAAILGLIVVFLPRFGVSLSKDEFTAIGAFAAAAIPIVIGLVVRQNVMPNAPPPAPPLPAPVNPPVPGV